METSPGPIYRFSLPSTLGSEKAAMRFIGDLASEHGAGQETVEIVMTLISEACLNAMEHGNHFDADKPVTVEVSVHSDWLSIRVCDSGTGLREADAVVEPYRIQRVMSKDIETRGWGLTIIHELSDSWHFNQSGGHTCLEMEVRMG